VDSAIVGANASGEGAGKKERAIRTEDVEKGTDPGVVPSRCNNQGGGWGVVSQ